MARVDVINTPTGQLVLARDRVQTAVRYGVSAALCALGAVGIVWLISAGGFDMKSDFLPLLFLAGLLVAFIYLAYRAVEVSRKGETYIFDRKANTLTHNGEVMARLDQIDDVEVVRLARPYETYTGGPVSYGVYVPCKNDRRAMIGSDFYEKEAKELGKVIANYAGVKVDNRFLL